MFFIIFLPSFNLFELFCPTPKYDRRDREDEEDERKIKINANIDARYNRDYRR